jgi:hypothetical protein
VGMKVMVAMRVVAKVTAGGMAGMVVEVGLERGGVEATGATKVAVLVETAEVGMAAARMVETGEEVTATAGAWFPRTTILVMTAVAVSASQVEGMAEMKVLVLMVDGMGREAVAATVWDKMVAAAMEGSTSVRAALGMAIMGKAEVVEEEEGTVMAVEVMEVMVNMAEIWVLGVMAAGVVVGHMVTVAA